jgi:Transposase DDE domain group 1
MRRSFARATRARVRRRRSGRTVAMVSLNATCTRELRSGGRRELATDFRRRRRDARPGALTLDSRTPRRYDVSIARRRDRHGRWIPVGSDLLLLSALVGMLRQSVFGRLAGYEDVNDAERLRHDPAMRWTVGGKAAKGRAASPSQMGRFESRWLAAPENLRTLADLSGQWIDRVRGYRSTEEIILDMDSSVRVIYRLSIGQAAAAACREPATSEPREELQLISATLPS